MRSIQLAAVDGCRYCSNLLDRRDGYPWPKAVVASSTGPTWAGLNRIPFASPFRSMPVLLPKPKSRIYLNSVSLPRRCPRATKPGLQEFSTTSRKVWLPCPPLLPAAQLRSSYLNIARIEKMLMLQIHLPLLQCRSQSYDLEGRARFIGHPDRKITVIYLGIVLLVSPRFITRPARHRQNLAIAGSMAIDQAPCA